MTATMAMRRLLRRLLWPALVLRQALSRQLGMPAHSCPLSGPLAAVSNACACHLCRSSRRGHDAGACPLSGSPRSSQACLRTPSVGPSRSGYLGSAFRLSPCPGLQCLGLCSHGSLSHICEFEARPAAPPAGKGAAFAAGSASLTADVITTTTTRAPLRMR